MSLKPSVDTNHSVHRRTTPRQYTSASPPPLAHQADHQHHAQEAVSTDTRCAPSRYPYAALTWLDPSLTGTDSRAITQQGLYPDRRYSDHLSRQDRLQQQPMTYGVPSTGYAPPYPSPRSPVAVTINTQQAEWEHQECSQAQDDDTTQRDTLRYTPARGRRIVPKGQRASKDFAVCTQHLAYNSIEAARDVVQGRTALMLPDDDVDMVEAEHQYYIKLMLDAFDREEVMYPPGDKQRDEAELHYFRQWQTEAHNSVVSKLRTELKQNPAFVEERCWAVFLAVIDMHRHGSPVIEEDNATVQTDTSYCCSSRIETIIEAMRDFNLVRLDILRRMRLDPLVAAPNAFVMRKLTNVFVNQKKQAKMASADLKAKKRRRTGGAWEVASDGEYQSATVEGASSSRNLRSRRRGR